MTAPTVTRWIYDFDEGSRDMQASRRGVLSTLDVARAVTRV